MSLFRRLLQDQRGNVAIISALMILPMLVLAGGATDIARYEAFRAQLQDGVDRAVLAAASLSQGLTVEETTRQYLKSVPFINDVSLAYDYNVSVNVRDVTITARYQMVTAFLPLVGINSMDIVARASAEERRSKIEISLMLDMSGSMRDGTPSKISLLKPAAQNFIDAVLNDQTKSYTSVNIVPYAGSVSVGATVFNMVGGARSHNNSSCFEFGNSEYGVGLVNFNGRAQVPHFTNWNYNTNVAGMNWWWCPLDDTALSFMSNDATYLKQRIANYKMHDGTGTAIAMNWGLMLLDPNLRPFMAQAAAANMIPSSFATRPAPYNDGETLKFIVLMTDGAISEQYRPNDNNRSTTLAPQNHQIYNSATALTHMNAVCDAAKRNGVTVFTIGFQVNSTAQTQMRNCATSASHFYNVDGLDIASAFQSIASAIQNVKLTR